MLYLVKRHERKTWVEINPMPSSQKIKIEAETEEEVKVEDIVEEDLKIEGNPEKVRADQGLSVTIVARRVT